MNRGYGDEGDFMRAKTSDKIFEIFIVIMVSLAVILCVIPILHVAAVSLSSNNAIISQQVRLLPVELTFRSYNFVINDKTMVRSLLFTIVLTVLYTLISMFMTVCAGYALTKKRLKGRNFFLLVIVITMYFGGGMIPNYLLIKNLKLINSIWSLILPGMLSTYNMIILKTFFTNMPDSIEESAYLDGCSDIGILAKIVLPLSTPVLATLSLFYAVGRWNGFSDALMYITKPQLYPLQLKLYQIIYNSMDLQILQNEGTTAIQVLPESIKSSCIIFATIPILLVYPWLQKYFVSGVMIGAIKG